MRRPSANAPGLRVGCGEKMKKSKVIRRGDIFYADLGTTVGSEQSGVRPVLIIQNNIGNRHSPTVIAAAITCRQSKASLPTHVKIGKQQGLTLDSYILLEQIRTMDKTRLRNYVGCLDGEEMLQVDDALAISLGNQ